MTISELIKELEAIKQKHGDIIVRCQTMSHVFPPDLKVKPAFDESKVLILNA